MRLFYNNRSSFSTPLQAQVPDQESIINTPTLRASEQGLKEMQLVKLNTDIAINQSFATTSMTMTFKNPNNQILAGNLIFPLPEGALVMVMLLT